MNLLPLFNVTQGSATALGIALSIKRREHRPVAWFLFVATIADYLRSGLRSAFDLGMPGPYAGLRRAAFHAESALFLIWAFGLAALALAVLACQSVRPVVVAYAVTVVTLTLAYPTIRGGVLHAVYAAVHGAALLTGAVSIVLWLRRDEPAREVEHASTVLLLALTGVYLLGPFVWGAFNSWTASHIASIAFYVTLSVLAVRALRRAL